LHLERHGRRASCVPCVARGRMGWRVTKIWHGGLDVAVHAFSDATVGLPSGRSRSNLVRPFRGIWADSRQRRGGQTYRRHARFARGSRAPVVVARRSALPVAAAGRSIAGTLTANPQTANPRAIPSRCIWVAEETERLTLRYRAPVRGIAGAGCCMPRVPAACKRE
jgi:hypothetical protein